MYSEMFHEGQRLDPPPGFQHIRHRTGNSKLSTGELEWDGLNVYEGPPLAFRKVIN